MKITKYFKCPVFLIIFFLLASLSQSAENPFQRSIETDSASFSESPFSHLTNPVFNDVPGKTDFSYQYQLFNEKSGGNHFLMMKILGISFTYAWYDYLPEQNKLVSADTNFFSINKGFFFNNVFGFGAGFSFSRSDTDQFNDYNSWTLGLLLRPYKYISFAFIMKEINSKINDESIKRKDIYSVSVRPFFNRLTLSTDFIKTSGESFSSMEQTYSVGLRLNYDISIFFKTDKYKNMSFGLKIPLFFRNKATTNINLETNYSNKKDNIPANYSFGISFPEEINNSSIYFTSKNYILIKFNRKINENEPTNFFDGKKTEFYDILNTIKLAGNDKTINGLIIDIDNSGLGFAQIQEIRNELINVKSAGKKVYAILNTPGNKEYYLATAADKIYFTPNSIFNITGLSASVYFYKKLLAKIGIKFESVKKGKYKSFNEPFTREGMSQEFRDNLTSLVKELNNQFLNDISKSRNIKMKIIYNLFESGIMTPEEAKANNFIDEVKYGEEVLEDIKKTASIQKLKNYLAEKKRNFIWGIKPRIAILYFNGAIVRGKTKNSRFFDSIGNETYEILLEHAFTDSSVKAIVIRINSGGGSAVASDLMLNKLIKLKKRFKKPVVFSFGNIAASGGYYVACSGDKIYSNRGTITGSIGVIFGKITLKKLYEKLGIKNEIIKMSKFADIFSESRELTDKEKEILQKGIDFTYNRFTGKVMKSRKIDKNTIPEVAEGKVFTGSQAEKNHLIDQIGGLLAAIKYAKSLSGLGSSYDIVKYPDQMTFINGILQTNDNLLLSKFMEKLYGNLITIKSSDENFIYLFPFIIKIR